MTKKQERNIIASVGTVLFMGFVILLLWLLQLSVTEQPKKDYIEVEYLEEEMTPPKASSSSSAAPSSTQKVPTPPAAQPNPIVEQPQVQQTEKIVTEEPKEVAVQNPPVNQDSIDAAKRREEELAQQRERERKNQEAKDKASFINDLGFGTNSGEGSNESGDNSNNVNSNENGVRDSRISGLDGRRPKTRDGKLPEPECTTNQPGRVAVQIHVDKDGNVTVASSSSAVGTNTADAEFIHCIENMLKKVKWTEGKGLSVGTITYDFVQKNQ